jgi:DNA polymerase (family 10)
MAQAAKELGYRYLAIADHSPHFAIGHGLDARRLAAQFEEIDRLNQRTTEFRVLKSCEIDILADGKLDLPDGLRDQLDVAVCAIHSNFNLSMAKQTERVMRAMDNPRFNIFAHPTGRLIGEREGYAIDLERVMSAAKERGCFLEVNAHPSRLDLDDTHCRAAREIGLKLAISTDAHSTAGLSLMRFGVDQARRGWIGPGDVLNTLPWRELRKLLAR